MSPISSPGITERHESLDTMWQNYPMLMTVVFLIIVLYLTVRETRKKDGSLLKLITYAVLTLISLWKVVITV
ncbi:MULTISPECIES: hypothetical protein [unclassified Colwellia]|uniref:hypothetical protein n=1 Tax=unclassified Colwellia TaxID=196834 RepID=UPI0015F48F43|nr:MULTISPECIES: hypothetical protein [unclassified Colwellia]MBA6231358.1 hypothetical protein [Colwellia sp. MB02u-7]MBA6235624.1 hypothetical protein [Colwellia sp. MB02u-11]MBA6298614.1 hypothetical protein [Colwellia sp. MB3u-22]MBA6309446.1 hypothetical protein [Colwellia sp. MB3u-64]